MNLMEWSQLQTGRMKFKPEHFEINTIVNEAILLMSVNAEQKAISITSTLPLGIQVFADKAMLSIVIRNLISNAIKFTQPHGQITIASAIKQAELTISVIDNGVGIPEEQIDKLFIIDKVNSTLGTHQEKETGLGLILCKEFIEQNNGKIWVESSDKAGSTFSFSLPLDQLN